MGTLVGVDGCQAPPSTKAAGYSWVGPGPAMADYMSRESQCCCQPTGGWGWVMSWLATEPGGPEAIASPLVDRAWSQRGWLQGWAFQNWCRPAGAEARSQQLAVGPQSSQG